MNKKDRMKLLVSELVDAAFDTGWYQSKLETISSTDDNRETYDQLNMDRISYRNKTKKMLLHLIETINEETEKP